MSEREDVEALDAEALSRVHFDGQGCGTYGINACSVCHGPSPMSAREVASEIARAPWLAVHDELVRADERKRLAEEVEALATERERSKRGPHDNLIGLRWTVDRLRALVPVPGVRLTEEA